MKNSLGMIHKRRRLTRGGRGVRQKAIWGDKGEGGCFSEGDVAFDKMSQFNKKQD